MQCRALWRSEAPSGVAARADALRYVALITFVSLVVTDMQETYDIHAWLRSIPSCEAPEYMRLLRFTERREPPGGKNMLVVPVSGITHVERALFYYILLVPKFVVAVRSTAAVTACVWSRRAVAPAAATDG